MVFAWTLLTAAIAGALLLFLLARRSGKRQPPGPRGLPFVGYLPWIDSEKPHRTFVELAEKYGGIYGVRLGAVFAVVLSDATLIREALASSNFGGRAPLYLTHGTMGGNGIICAEGEKWKDQRKFVTSSLRALGMVRSGEKRCGMEAKIMRGVNAMLEKLRRTTEAIDTEPLVMHTLGNVVFDVVFGKTWPEEDETWQKLLRYQEEGTKLIGIAGPINFLPFLRFLPRYGRAVDYIRNGMADSHRIYQEILAEYRRSERPNGDDGPGHFLAAFDREMVLRGDRPGHYTPQQFNFLAGDLWGAGVDTTAATLRWFFLYMATDEEAQEAVRREMDAVVGERSLALSDAPRLPLLRAAISEVQRIRSVTPLGFPHGAVQDGYLAGYSIPKGSMIVPLQWAVHMNPVLHPRPEVYDPRRFIDEDGRYFRPEGFLPFQTGKRVCPGEELANMMLFLYGGSVLQNYSLSPEGAVSLEGEVGITMTPRHHRIRFAKRRGESLAVPDGSTASATEGAERTVLDGRGGAS